MHKKVDDTMNELLKPNERKAFPKGGRIVHIIDMDTSPISALCGKTPQDDKYSRMRRAGWWGATHDREVECPKCRAILEARRK